EIGSLFAFDNFVNNLIAIIIAAVVCGFCFLLFPLFFFVGPILADHPGVGFMDAVKGALAFGKGNFVPTFFLGIVIGIVIFIGELACGVGVLITAPVAYAAIWIAYEEHKAAIHAAAAEGGVTLA